MTAEVEIEEPRRIGVDANGHSWDDVRSMNREPCDSPLPGWRRNQCHHMVRLNTHNGGLGSWGCIRCQQSYMRLSGAEKDPTALSPREHEVLVLVADGHTKAIIAREMSISESTVKTHFSKIMEKMGAKNSAHAVLLAMRSGVLR